MPKQKSAQFSVSEERSEIYYILGVHRCHVRIFTASLKRAQSSPAVSYFNQLSFPHTFFLFFPIGKSNLPGINFMQRGISK